MPQLLLLLAGRNHSNNLFISCFMPITILLFLASPSSACSQLDRESLLSFLAGLSPTANNSLLGSWNSSDCCLWEGIECNTNGAVTRISLPAKGLKGEISPALANLTQLSYVDLSHNWLTGTLPSALLWSSSIITLDVSFNRLAGGLPELSLSSHGGLPVKVLNVSSNCFTGPFPSFSWRLTRNLVALNGSGNSFTGLIPASLCSASPNLVFLDLSRNQFGGNIPEGFGNCSELRVFAAGHNNLTGTPPGDLFEAASLQQLSLPYNQLAGVLDGELIAKFSNLITLDLGDNELRGHLPESISQLTKLEHLTLCNNRLWGNLPSSLTNCTSLKDLNLRANNFSGELSAFNFSNLSNLNTIDLGYNNFAGNIPENIYACRSLNAMRLSANQLTGQVSHEMINLQALSFLSLSINNMTNISGTLNILKSCKNISAILLAENFKGEVLPDVDSVSGFENLQILSFGNCQLTGQIPSWLSKLTNLEVLDLSGNKLTGTIPSWFNTLPKLFYLDISGNYLSGEIPKAITGMPLLASEQTVAQLDPSYLELPVFSTNYNSSDLQYNKLSALPPALKFGHNNFTGVIPPEIGRLKKLQVLDLSSNNLSDGIPPQLDNLTNLENLNLSSNHLTGMIPPSLNKLSFLAKFSVADNDLEGPIPSGNQFDTFPSSSFLGNPKLCGSQINKTCSNSTSGGVVALSPKRTNRKLLFVVSLCITFGGCLALLLLAYYLLSTKNITNAETGSSDSILTYNSTSEVSSVNIKESTMVMVPQSDHEIKDLTFSDILKATNNFDQANIIGCGGYGLVYKAELDNGMKLAIKKLSGDMGLMEREFKAEVEALSMVQHENLVPLQGYCSQGSFKFLIYSYMENGSLDDWLHDRDDVGMVLDWPARLRIAQGSSRGLSYIHQICEPHIVHRDIKSSNILLDKEFEARVADFGLSRLILPYKTHVTTELVGTLGYIPPEYGQAWVATLRGDVYSFGVVMLELITGKRPVEVLPSQSTDLVGWVQDMKCKGEQIKVLDPLLRGKGYEEQMLQVLDVACMCTDQNPFNRPTINEVVSWLDNIDNIVEAQI
ncbi:tyrosine-sulfated glycopeptide receptor 1 [Typha angustifolia]|uniref:tyrosine-sulfated glycopeptide receptor 1 n=1 Tax=Typha angustifolia TaxID=59011 RepID=UPI003C2AEE5C